MELDHSSTKEDAFCTIPKDYLQDFHHLDITFSLAEGPSTFNTNPDHMNFTIEMNNDYDLLFDSFFSNEVVNCSPIDQDFNFDNYHEFESFEQNGGGGSGSTQVVTKNFESSMDMNYNFSNCDHDLKPIINFNVVSDESSCITSTVDNIYGDKEIDERKNKKSLSSSSMRKLEKSTRKKSKSAKSQWTIEEDRILINLVEKFGDRKWSQIAQMLKGRIGKQCRERWHNHLRPDIKKELWTEEEDRILIEAHAEIGNKWAEIAKRLAGRTENSIKNHWNATKRRQLTKRKCRTKWPRPSSLLLNYIKSFNSKNGNINAAKVVEPVEQVPADFSAHKLFDDLEIP